MIKIKRAYDRPHPDDGGRILIDGLWPKGLDKKDNTVTLWFRQLAPTPPLRKWFDNDPKKFPEFTKRYKKELLSKGVYLARIKSVEREKGTVTILYEAKDHLHNIAVVVAQILAEKYNT
jgi:uncharacterized protein YeaO (DUF488 family)